MTPDNNLRWAVPDTPVLAHLRFLHDGQQTIAIMDFWPPDNPESFRGGVLDEWMPTYVTHGVIDQAEGVFTKNRMPALGLSDGAGGLQARIGFVNPEAWDRLCSTVLPIFEEGERKIEFPRLPSKWVW
jgi:hypothetical protein